MFDFSWSEILLIGVVALVVIGPKDLPRVLKTVGQWVHRARTVARDFQFQIDQMVRDSELDDVRKTMSGIASGNPANIIKNMIDPTGDLEKSISTPELLGQTPAVPLETPSGLPAEALETSPETPQAAALSPPALPVAMPETVSSSEAEAKSDAHG
jgi:sec-independent protein translocase protein TatB